MLNKNYPVVKSFFANTVDIIYPPQCLSCRKLVGQKGNLCSDCWEGIHFLSDPQCDQCGIPFEFETGKEMLCGNCITKEPPYKKARSVFKYDDASRSLITGFKYSDKLHISDHFAKWMLRVGKEFIDEADIIVPVPLHRVRLFMRRYNQAALLSKSLGNNSGLNVCNDMLVRSKNTRPQAGLLFKQRALNVRGAFKINPKYTSYIVGKNIILVDDVMTTGATIEACAKVLKKAGAASVNVLTVGRTVKE